MRTLCIESLFPAHPCAEFPDSTRRSIEGYLSLPVSRERGRVVVRLVVVVVVVVVVVFVILAKNIRTCDKQRSK